MQDRHPASLRAGPWVFIFLLSSVVFLVAFPSLLSTQGTAAVVQQRGAGCAHGSCTSSELSVPLNPVEGGDVLVVAAVLSSADENHSQVSVSDSLGSVFAQAASGNNTDRGGSEFISIYCATVSTGGPDRVTVALDGVPRPGEAVDLYVYEVSGVTLASVGASRSSGHSSGLVGWISVSSLSLRNQRGAFLLGVVAVNSEEAAAAGAGFVLSNQTSGSRRGYAEFAISGSVSSTNFPAKVYSPGLTLWAELGLVLEPKPR